ncbi:MAG: T9SS type A sorting domain-containing protein [Paludibacter sp.]
MKKYITLSVLSLFILNNLSAQILPVPLIQQEQTQWCWTGVSKSVLDYYNYSTSQCNIAEYARNSTKVLDFGTQNCCDFPTGSCNNWNYPFDTPGSIQDIFKYFKGIQSVSKYDSLKINDARTEISNFRPFIIRWLWNGTSNGHFVIGHGIVDKTLYYMNPWFGEGLKIANYDWVRYNSDHTWTHTLVLTTNPTILSVSTNMLTISATENSSTSFEITSNLSWNAISNQNWLTVSSQNGLGSKTITLTAATNPINVARTAIVTISATDVNSQTITVTQTENGITAIKNTFSNILPYYPNPVSNDLTIYSIEKGGYIEIIDLTGKIMTKKIADSNIEKIDVSSLQKGVYTIRLTDNFCIKTAKLFKQ